MIEKLKKDQQFNRFCTDKGISRNKLFNLSKTYGGDIAFFQIFDKERGKLGLMDDQPAKVILKAWYEDGVLKCELSSDYLDYVG